MLSERRSDQSEYADARAVALEPQKLQLRRAPIGEHEHRASLQRVHTRALARSLRETIEATSHVDGLRAHEDPNATRDH
jgi:hypothetical protein